MDWLEVKQVAAKIGVSRMYLWRHRRDGQAPPAHQRGRKVLYLRSEVEQWMREQRVT